MNTLSNTQSQNSPHIEYEQFKNSPAAENPIGESFNVVVSVPDSIKIRMVDASALGDYEIWIFIASLLSNAVVGFAVAYFQAVDAKSSSTCYIGWTWVMFFVLFLASIATACRKRTAISKQGRDIKLKTSSATVADRRV